MDWTTGMMQQWNGGLDSFSFCLSYNYPTVSMQ